MLAPVQVTFVGGEKALEHLHFCLAACYGKLEFERREPEDRQRSNRALSRND